MKRWIVLAILLSLSACDDGTITAYPITETKSEDPLPWLALNPTTYSRQGDSIVSNTIGILSRYDRCVVADIENWECTFDDGSGQFGFRQGSHWRDPVFDDVYVGRLEYNVLRCRWHHHDEGLLGIMRCILSWR